MDMMRQGRSTSLYGVEFAGPAWRLAIQQVVSASRSLNHLLFLFLPSADRRSKNVVIHAATCNASHSSNAFTISDMSQSLQVTPAAIAGVIFKV